MFTHEMVFEGDFTPSEKLLLLLLVRESDAAGFCQMSVRDMARMCGMAERTVQRVVRTLEFDGVLEVMPQQYEDGGSAGNIYRILSLVQS